MAGEGTIVACPRCGTRNRVRRSTQGAPRCSVCHADLPWIVEATPDAFAQELASSLPVLVDFWAPWCGPCRMVSPTVERLARENAGRLKVVKLNVDEAPAISARYDVRGIPLLLLIRDGAEVDRLTGAAPPARLQAWLEPHLRPVSEAHPVADQS
ncbi:MAG: thioredoxin [Solirubrobacterales bacterium]|jgi:thioredoxin 2|nr:thioredoxin [Solirubrobacterales bacterium]